MILIDVHRAIRVPVHGWGSLGGAEKNERVLIWRGDERGGHVDAAMPAAWRYDVDAKNFFACADGDHVVGLATSSLSAAHKTQVTPRAATPTPHSRTRRAHALPRSPVSCCAACHNLHVFLHTLANKH